MPNFGCAFICKNLRCKATLKREFKLPWREAGPPNYYNDEVDSDQQVVHEELSLSASFSGLRVKGEDIHTIFQHCRSYLLWGGWA